MMERIYLENGAKIERLDLYRVRVTLPDGSQLPPLEPRCLFPLSDPVH